MTWVSTSYTLNPFLIRCLLFRANEIARDLLGASLRLAARVGRQRRWRHHDRRVQRRGMLEIEQVLERVRVEIARGEVWSLVFVVAVSAQEALLEERQERCVVTDGVRYVVRLGEGRDSDERHSEPILIEGRTTVWIRIKRCRVRTERQRVELAEGAVGPRAGTGLVASAHWPGKTPSGVRAWP